MKRTLSLILIFTMLLSLAACGSKDAAPPDDDNAPPQEQGGGEEQSGGTTGTPKPETPAEDKPAAAVDDALTILNAIWNTYSDEEKFPAAGGDSEHAVDGAPGSFDVSNADSLSYQLTFPADDASLIDSAASLVHMMNLNTFTCGAFHVADANNVARLADDLRTTIQAKHWMCGFPDKMFIATSGNLIVAVYGDEELVNTFRDKLQAAYSGAVVITDEPIVA